MLPGQVVQVGALAAPTATAGVTDLDGAVAASSVALDPLDLVTAAPFGPAPLGAHAVPRQAVAANGLRFDPTPARRSTRCSCSPRSSCAASSARPSRRSSCTRRRCAAWRSTSSRSRSCWYSRRW